MSFVLPLALQLLSQQTPTFHSDADFVAVDVQVLSRDKPVLGLQAGDFLVWDNGELQSISHLGFAEQVLDIMLVLDASNSTIPVTYEIKDSASRALSFLDPRDRVAVVFFAAEPYFVTGLTADRALVDDEICRIPWGHDGTELNTPVLYSALYLKHYSRPEARRAIVILTDNKGFRDVRDRDVLYGLWEADAVLNAIFFSRTPGFREEADVRRFVDATGGDILNGEANHVPLPEMFRRMRQRYVLLYRAPGGKPGAVRRIRVDLTPAAKSRVENLKIRARTGYRVGEPGSEARRILAPPN